MKLSWNYVLTTPTSCLINQYNIIAHTNSMSLWWSSKGAWKAPCAAEMDEGMEASWKALASNGRWKRW